MLGALALSAHPGAKKALAVIWNAEDRRHALGAVTSFKAAYGAKFPKAVTKIADDLEQLLVFYDFSAEHWIQSAHHESGYERLASPGCSDRTIRRRFGGVGRGWPRKRTAPDRARGLDRMIGLDLDDLSVDGLITKSPCGGEVSGRSPVERGKQGTKRSVACDSDGIPLHLIAARANDHDSPLFPLCPTQAGICEIGPLPNRACMHLDRGYDSRRTRDLLEILGYEAQFAVKGVPAPIQVGKRWPVERTHSW